MTVSPLNVKSNGRLRYVCAEKNVSESKIRVGNMIPWRDERPNNVLCEKNCKMLCDANDFVWYSRQKKNGLVMRLSCTSERGRNETFPWEKKVHERN